MSGIPCASSATTTTTTSSSSSTDNQEICNIRNLLWGANIKVEVFRRWSQGFEFSKVEPSALVQHFGGPCAVIAPVQAFLLKILLIETPGHSLGDLTHEKCKTLLIQALCDILMKCKQDSYRILQLPDAGVEAKEETQCQQQQQQQTVATATVTELNLERHDVNDMDDDDDDDGQHGLEKINQSPPYIEWNPDEFHERLSIMQMQTIDDVQKYYSDNFHVLSGQYGVLLFMYTAFLTKNFENIMDELLDTSEPLIHDTYGYAAQALINLMLTGRAVPHVWDHDKDVGGLKLRGLNQQSDVGFITLMEQLRYCTVGSFYKNPKNPVWVMGSETHLTVLFSNEKRLVSPETPNEVARRVFKSYDPDGNNFIPSPVLQDVLCSLELVSEPEYVDIMQKKLDPESLGIILLNSFMDEFFPEEKRSVPDTFDLFHYNGIPGSNIDNQIRYHKGSAILLESDLKSMCSISNTMLTCLQTKWPTIEVNWHNNNRPPSLN